MEAILSGLQECNHPI